jgi:tRNA pseudouridine38-40 synthase
MAEGRAGRPARLALGVAYRGGAYHGWQLQRDAPTVQGALEAALGAFAHGEAVHAPRVAVTAAGRTDAGVHAVQQVVHLDPPVERAAFSWVRGTNRFLPGDIAVQWCRPVPAAFDARRSATGRRYRYLLRESPVRPALEQGLVGWSFLPLAAAPMRQAAAHWIGEHDFTSFRAAGCQAKGPVKTLRRVRIGRRGLYWAFDFEADAFLHHMVRNLMGCLLAVGRGERPPAWAAEVLAARSRAAAAPTVPAEGLYFVGPDYDAGLGLPRATPPSLR